MFYFDFISMTDEEKKVFFIGIGILLVIVIIGYSIKYIFENRKSKKKID